MSLLMSRNPPDSLSVYLKVLAKSEQLGLPQHTQPRKKVDIFPFLDLSLCSNLMSIVASRDTAN